MNSESTYALIPAQRCSFFNYEERGDLIQQLLLNFFALKYKFKQRCILVCSSPVSSHVQNRVIACEEGALKGGGLLAKRWT
jgi:hypothetical protein